MKPTQILTDEHKAIKVMLRILAGVSNRLEAGDRVETGDLEKMVDFIREFADRCHHLKEEDLLFPAMEEAGIPGRDGPIGVMLAEHEQGRAYVRGMAEAMAEIKSGGRSGSARFAENARAYASLLSGHIDKEDNVLYRIADAHIPRPRQDELIAQFEKVESEQMGPGVHEKYHALIHDLEKTYAGA